jgi:hypothetical protein
LWSRTIAGRSGAEALPLVAAAIAVAVVFSAATYWWASPDSAVPGPVRFLHVPPTTAPIYAAQLHRDLAISHDGRTLVYAAGTVGQAALQIRRLDQIDAAPLRGGDAAVAPFFRRMASGSASPTRPIHRKSRRSRCSGDRRCQ